ncbi:hypothetical protein [Pseudomonas fluorescens]|uniref:hypothetical protein n=1 Tax=Pseudomonas fluorescens TaxID=294 RepID=UPI0021E524C8|nr:hypothetical protein [Pseudomonas fluorescens]
MVLDEGISVPEVCASLDIGPTALRRWVAGSPRFAKSAWVQRRWGPKRLQLTTERFKNSKPCSGKKTGILKS